MLQSILETSIVAVTVWVSLYTFPLTLTIHEIALVDLPESFTRAPRISSFPMFYTIDPFACENIPI